MAHVTENALGKKGMLYGKLLMSWASIIGADKAKIAVPIKVSFYGAGDNKGKKTGATLTVAASSAQATLLHHEAPLWIEKINLFFGYPAIEKIKIVHTSDKDKSELSPRRSTRVRERRLNSSQKDALKQLVDDITDEDLKNVLLKYGESLYGDIRNK